MRNTLALTSIESVALHHRFGHTCHDGRWHNPGTGTRTPCPVLATLDLTAGQVRGLGTQVHDAAHDDATAYRVGLAAAGYEPGDVNDQEVHDGVLAMGRQAIEALAYLLDRDPDLEARHAAATERIRGQESA